MDKPIRHSNHILSEKSKKFLNSCLPDEWVVNELKNDYGIDYLVDIVDKNCVTGFSFLIQLKSHHKGNNKDTVSVVINRSTLNFWITKLDPILIIAYVKETNEAYYKWINSNDFDLTQKSKTFSLTIDKKNELTKINWDEVKKYIKSISSKRNLLYDNDIDFSSLKDEEKLALENYFKGNVETALHHFFNILNNSPENPVTLSSIAMCYYKSYDYNKALVYINKALSLFQHKKLYFNKACILVEAGLYNNQYEKLLEAKKIFSENIEESDNFHIHYSYANALSHIPGEENFLLAEKEFKIALQQNPNYAKAWKNLGSLYFNEGRHEEELKCYSKALLINPNLPEALFSMGMTLHQIFNKNKLGLRFILQAVSILGDKLPLKLPNSYFVVARLLFRIKDYEGCIVWINEGLRNNPGDKDLVHLKIYFYTKFWKKKEHFENAKKFFSESIKYSENIIDCIYLLTLIMKFEKKTSEEIYRFIKTHVKIFEQIDFLDLKKFSLSVNDIIDTIPYIREYMNFKLVVQDEVFNIPLETTKILDLPLFLHTFEIICLVVFSKTIIFAKKNLNSKNIESLICDRILSNFFKSNVRISFYLLSQDKISAQDRLTEILIISQSFSYFSTMVASNMIGYIIGNFSLNKSNIKLDLIQNFAEKFAEKLEIYLKNTQK